MKKTIFTIALIVTTVVAMATTHTVDNKPNAGAQFDDLQAAIDAAAAGDTIYVAGSPTNYGGITITKQLAIIGAGYKVDNQYGLSTYTGSITFKEGLDEFNDPVSNPSDSYISGVKVDEGVFSQIAIKNGTGILIERCAPGRINLDDNVSVTIRNSIISNFLIESSVVNLIVQNSIIKHYVNSQNSASNVLIDHSLFHGGYLSQTKYVQFTNCIMYTTNTDGAEYCTFSNNISIGGSTTEFLYDSNTGGSNLVATNPQFEVINNSNAFDYNNDYRLQSGSPAIGAGSDGTDIGIYGGNYPFPIGGEGEFLMAAPPKIPQIMELNIQNATVPEDGTLNVQLKARKQN